MKRQRARLLRGVLAFLAFALIALLATFSAVRWRWHRQIKEQLDAAKLAGLPTTAAELDAWYAAVPASNNAALFYEELFQKMSTNRARGTFPSFRRDEPLTQSASNELRALVRANSEALELARHRIPMMPARYSVDLSLGVNAPLPHLTKLKRLSHLLRGEALLYTVEGKSTDAVESILAIHCAARTLDEEPLLTSTLVALAMDANAFVALERLLNHSTLNPDQLIRLAEATTEADRTNRFVKGLIADRAVFGEIVAMAQYDLQKLQRLAPSEDSEEASLKRSVQPGLGWHLIGFSERDRAFYLRAMATNIAVAHLAPPASLQATQAIENLNAKAKDGYYIFSSLLLPALSKMSFRDAEASARARNALVALAVESWRAAHNGSVPDSLSQLTPQFLRILPTDPFDGQLIRYKKLQIGYIVYSIGRDGRDDGGKEQPPRGTKLSRAERDRFDITFVVER